jgi:hypothetical protein
MQTNGVTRCGVVVNTVIIQKEIDDFPFISIVWQFITILHRSTSILSAYALNRQTRKLASSLDPRWYFIHTLLQAVTSSSVQSHTLTSHVLNLQCIGGSSHFFRRFRTLKSYMLLLSRHVKRCRSFLDRQRFRCTLPPSLPPASHTIRLHRTIS